MLLQASRAPLRRMLHAMLDFFSVRRTDPRVCAPSPRPAIHTRPFEEYITLTYFYCYANALFIPPGPALCVVCRVKK